MKEKRLFYGWFIVATVFLANFINTGEAFYAMGVFFKPLIKEFGWSRAITSVGISLSVITGALFAPILGRLVDRYGARSIMPVGAAVVGLSFVLLSRMNYIWHFYLFYGIMLSLGSRSMGEIPGSTSVSNWFIKKRGLALGIATMGISMGGVIMPPLANYFISRFGWRVSFFFMAIFPWAVVIPLSIIFIRKRPEDLGLNPDGIADSNPDPALPDSENDRYEVSIGARAALKTSDFWKLAVAFSFSFMSLGTVLIHLVPHLTDLGISPTTAAFCLGLTAAVGVVGKVILGWLTDIMEKRFVAILAYAFQIVGLIILLNARYLWLVYLFCVCFGFGMGGVIPIHQSFLGERFGRDSFGSIYGLMAPFTVFFQALGQPFAGYVFDVTGSYHLAFLLFIINYFLAAIIIFSVRRKSPQV